MAGDRDGRRSGEHPPETLRTWVRREEVDEGRRPGVTTEEKARIAELERDAALLSVDGRP